MKPTKLVIHLAKHIPTGAEIPVIVNQTDSNNVITDYKEFMENRKGFTIAMLQERWDLPKEDSIKLIKKYQVPAHVDHQDIKNLPEGGLPVDAAIFFEEYIFGIEKKENLTHTKLKSRALSAIRKSNEI